jgi:O-Antigen ligase
MFGGYIFLAVVALMTALAILWWPAKTAGVLLLFAPIIWGVGAADIHVQGQAPLNVAMAVSGVATLIYARCLLLPQRGSSLKWLRTASIVYCLAILPSVFLRASIQSFGGYVRLISPVVFMFALLHGSRPRGVHTFQFKAFALATVSLLGIIVVAQYTGEGSYSFGGFDRLRAFNLSPQHISLYSVAALGVLVCGVLLGKHRQVYTTGIISLMVCTYLTGFRTAWIGMAILIGIVMVFAVRSRFAKFVALLIALALLGARGIIIQSLARYAHEDAPMSVDMLDAITSGRITTDSITLNRYLTGSPGEWLFGIGVYSAEEVTLREQGAAVPVHSDLLATLIECGVVGLVGYVFLLIIIGWILLHVRRYLPQQHDARTFLEVAWALFVAFTIMGIPGALYTNVFVGWYYYGFIGFALAQLKVANPSFGQVLSRRCGMDRLAVSAKATMSPA